MKDAREFQADAEKALVWLESPMVGDRVKEMLVAQFALLAQVHYLQGFMDGRATIAESPPAAPTPGADA